LSYKAWTSHDELHDAVVHWIQHTYDRRRRQCGLGKLTPVEFELAFTPADSQAATAA
jgi:putative transposase